MLKWINISGLTQENIKEWIKIVRNRKLLDIDIKSIWERTSGLPVLLEPWINRSKNLDITEIDVNQFCHNIILQYLDIDTNIITKINKLSILKYPFETDALINYLNLSSNEDYNILSYDLVKYGIFDKSKGWFRNDVIQNCFRNNVIDQQLILFHQKAASYYETIVKEDLHLTKRETLINLIEYSYHLHYGQVYEKSYLCNRKAAYELWRLGDLSIAEDCLRRSIIDSEKLDGLNKKMKSIFLLSSQILIVNGGYDEAQKNFDELLTYYEGIDDKEMQFNVLNSIAQLLRIRGKYKEALEKYEQNLQIAKKNNDLDHIAVSLNNIGIVNKHLQQYNTALDNFHMGLFIALIMGNDRKITTGLHNVGIIHDILGENHYDNKEYDLAFQEFDKALNLYQQCYDIEEKLNDEMGKSKLKNDIGMIYLHKDEYDKALSYFEESLAMKQKIGHYEGIYNNLYNIGLVYIDKDEYDKALPYLKDALEMAKSIGNQKEIDKVNHEINKITRNYLEK